MLCRNDIVRKIKDFQAGNLAQSKLVDWAENLMLDYLEEQIDYEPAYESLIDDCLSTLAGLDLPGFLDTSENVLEQWLKLLEAKPARKRSSDGAIKQKP